MRINIQLPDRSNGRRGAALASTSRLDLSRIPFPLVQLAQSSASGGGSDGDAGTNSGQELALIELQGSMEIDDAHPDGGQVLAKLEFHKGREDRPTLLISHHRLEGKLVSLTKPLVVLERKQRTNGRRGSDDVSANETAYTTEAETRNVMAEVGVNTDKASKQAEKRKQRKEDADIPSSPFRYGRARAGSDGVGMGPPVSPSRSGGAELELQDDAPDSPTMAVKSTGLLNTGETAPSRRGASPQPSMSSSPMPAPHMRGSEIDYSSPVPASKRRRTIGERTVQVTSDADGIPHDVNGELIEDGAEAGEREGIEEADWLYKRETSTYFEVVCIIRKKLLFSKRPEPVVRLDGEGAEQARAAIGRSKVA